MILTEEEYLEILRNDISIPRTESVLRVADWSLWVELQRVILAWSYYGFQEYLATVPLLY
jgi:hypothetical protein